MFAARSIVTRYLIQNGRRHYTDLKFKQPTMDELPVPMGSWQADYDAKQKGYNAVLAFGIAFCTFSIGVAKASGLVYLNYNPPKSLD